jgi:predicted HTH transcriptional regulator
VAWPASSISNQPSASCRRWQNRRGNDAKVVETTGTTKNGGLVLFGRRPQAELESSRVVVGALVGDDIGDDFVDRKDLSGPLLGVIAQIETFLLLHLRTGHEIVGFEKEKREEIPMAALREAVVNALVHRDYTIAGPTRVFVLSDRVEVRSPGRPPNSMPRRCERAYVLSLPRGPATPSASGANQTVRP